MRAADYDAALSRLIDGERIQGLALVTGAPTPGGFAIAIDAPVPALVQRLVVN
jgi:hypothetical protein